jgi:hypothetical protein
MATPVPNSYKDPYWSDLSTNTERKLGLPDGMLRAVVLYGERSNNDQVSSADARTPYQIIPSARNLAIKAYGIDPYLSPENAAEVAGRFLKDSLDRNKGDKAKAFAEYHGGTNPANWGPITQSYITRTMGGLSELTGQPAQTQAPTTAPAPAPAATTVPAPAPSTPPGQPPSIAEGGTISTFERAQRASGQAALPDNAIANIYQAYTSGQMSPQEAQEFEADVRGGTIMLPRGASLQGGPVQGARPTVNVLPAGVLEAYTGNKMSRAEMVDLERDVRNGVVRVPEGFQLGTTELTPSTTTEGVMGAVTRGLAPIATGAAIGAAAGAPLMGVGAIPGALAGAGAAGLATFAADPIVGAVNSLFGTNYTMPTQAMEDLLTRAGVAKPKSEAERILQTAVSGAAGAGGGVALGRTLQAAAGAGAPVTRAVGQVLASQPVLQTVAGATGGAAGQTAAELGAGPIGQIAATVAGGVTPFAPQLISQMARTVSQRAATPTQPGVPPPPMSGEELAATTRRAAEGGFGSTKATEALAAQAAPDQKTLDAAKRLGIEDYLDVDHLTTNQAAKELIQAVKSFPGSQARASEIAGLNEVGRKADELITKIGGTTDLSQLNQSVKNQLSDTVKTLDISADKAYTDLRTAIPLRTRGEANEVLTFINQRGRDLDGNQNLSSLEKNVLRKLTPKLEVDENGVVTGVKNPTYALIDDVRKDIGAAARQSGKFKDADTGLAKQLYKLIDNDQLKLADNAGFGDQYLLAKSLVSVRKGFEDDMVALFGKQLDQSLVSKLSDATMSLTKGDSEKLVKILKAIPEDMRQSVAASALNTAFGKATQNGQLNFNTYANFYEGLLQNKQGYAALMNNLPQSSRKALSDLYRVSNGVRNATRERITTGRIQSIQKDLQGVDTLASNLFGIAKRAAFGLPLEAASTAVGLPGAGLASGIASALTKGKPDIAKKADELLNSPAFKNLVRGQ